MTISITHDVDETRDAVRALGPVAFVPTMGALHEGHLSLIRRAVQLADRVVVSIFVNPMQFGPTEDFDKYPRPLERDLSLCEQSGAHLVFVPPVEAIYPPGETDVIIDVPALTADLEGALRPGHFIGVCRVVAKLLSIIQPRFACFGQKDYQQLRVIEAMVAGLCLPVKIERCATIREPDGLACSSRNAYLSPDHRPRAAAVFKALSEAQRLIEAGEMDPARVEQAMRQELEMHRLDIDYAAVRHARSLSSLDMINPAIDPVVCLVAARLGSVRLIDNILIG